MHYKATSLFSLAAILLVPSVYGQDDLENQPQNKTGSERFLEEVVVTARKRAESVQDVPVSVTALTPSQLEKYEINSLERLAATMPDLRVARSNEGSGAQLTIRGIGSSFLSAGIQQSTAIVIDGTYYGHGHVLNEALFDLERLEVMKGPQALFYGKNASAGVISIATADPGDQKEFIARAGYEVRGQQTYGEAIWSAPVTETFGARLALRASKMHGSYFDNRARTDYFYPTIDAADGMTFRNYGKPRTSLDLPGEEQYTGRLTLKWTPSDALSNTLKISGNRTTTNGFGSTVVPECAAGRSTYQLDPSQACVKGKFATFSTDFPVEVAQAGIKGIKANGEPFSKYTSYSINNSLSYELDDTTFSLVANYNKGVNEGTSENSFAAQNASPSYTYRDEVMEDYSVEGRVDINLSDSVSGMFGIYYQNAERTHDQMAIFGNVEDSGQPDSLRYVAYNKRAGTDGETVSAFGQIRWDILPTVEIAVGARYIDEEKDSFNQHPYVNTFLAGLFTTTPVRYDQSFSEWTPEATVTWSPSENMIVYGGYKTGYKSGGYSISSSVSSVAVADPSTLAFKPELAKGFEGGIKTTLLDRSLRFNVAVYRYEYTDLQFEFFNGSNFATETMTGDARNKGIEVTTEWLPPALTGLTLRGAVNYNEAKYTEFIAPCYTGQTLAQGCTLIVNGAEFQDASGNRLPNAPRWSASLGGDYERDIGNNLWLTLAVGAQFSSSYSLSAFGNEGSTQSGYTSFNASIALGTNDQRWTVSLIGRNLTNRFIRNGTVDLPGTGGGTGTNNGILADQFVFVSMPRTVEAQITFRY